MTSAKAALALLKAGFSVIPIRPDGSKAPAIGEWKRYQAERMADAAAFDDGTGIAIIGGAVSGGLEIIDVEVRANWDELRELIEEASPGLIARLPIVRTAGGGYHIYLRCESVQSNQKLAMQSNADGRPEVLIETRGEGGYVLAPGSPGACHASGKTYDLIQGRITQTPVISPEERDVLLDCARSFNTWTPPAPDTQTSTTPAASKGARPGDDYNARGPVLEELQSEGWAIERKHGDEYILRRPGKKKGASAIWHADKRFLYVFSSNAYPFGLNEYVSPFRIYSLLRHGGDDKASARKLGADGYGSQQPPRRGPVAVPKSNATSGALALAPSSQPDDYLRNNQNALRPLLANAIRMLNEPVWQGVLAYDEFGECVTALKPPPWSKTTPPKWGDQEVRRTTEWMQYEHLYVNPEIVGQACQTIARLNPFHPVRQYLDGLTWDEEPRAATWAERYLGAPGDPYTQAVAKCWLISAVARVHTPGCKADHVLILEGPQGVGKSSAVRALGEPWFSDEMADVGSKDAAMQTKGVWILELAELDTLSRAETGAIKAFMSRAVDHYRPPYGKHVIDSPRQCVFIGTANHATYLRDETGGRRFWPIKCGTLDPGAITRDRDQLWAEAVHLYRSGAKWWLDSKYLQALAAAEQDARYDGDAWGAIIEPWIENPEPQNQIDETFTSSPGFVTISDVLTHCIAKRQDQWNQQDHSRVARILRSLGWGPVRKGTGDRERGFSPIAKP